MLHEATFTHQPFIMQTIGKSIYISLDLRWFVIQIKQWVNSFLSIYDKSKKNKKMIRKRCYMYIIENMRIKQMLYSYSNIGFSGMFPRPKVIFKFLTVFKSMKLTTFVWIFNCKNQNFILRVNYQEVLWNMHYLHNNHPFKNVLVIKMSNWKSYPSILFCNSYYN